MNIKGLFVYRLVIFPLLYMQKEILGSLETIVTRFFYAILESESIVIQFLTRDGVHARATCHCALWIYCKARILYVRTGPLYIRKWQSADIVIRQQHYTENSPIRIAFWLNFTIWAYRSMVSSYQSLFFSFRSITHSFTVLMDKVAFMVDILSSH
jgi:hypothetical protein